MSDTIRDEWYTQCPNPVNNAERKGNYMKVKVDTKNMTDEQNDEWKALKKHAWTRQKVNGLTEDAEIAYKLLVW